MFGNSSICKREVVIISILQGSEPKKLFSEGCSWFNFNNLRLALGMAFKFYTIVAKALKLNVRMFWRLIPTFVEVTRGKLVGENFFQLSILNRVKTSYIFLLLRIHCLLFYTIVQSIKRFKALIMVIIVI